MILKVKKNMWMTIKNVGAHVFIKGYNDRVKDIDLNRKWGNFKGIDGFQISHLFLSDYLLLIVFYSNSRIIT